MDFTNSDPNSPITVFTDEDNQYKMTGGDIIKEATKAIPLTAVGAMDTVASSLSLGYLDKNVVSDALLDNALGYSMGLKQSYSANEEGYKLAGDVATMFLGAGIALKATRGKGLITGAAKRLGYVTEAGTIAGEELAGGYLSAETLGASRASGAIMSGAEDLDVLRHMMRTEDIRRGANGVLNLEENRERLAALSNIRRLGVTSTADEMLAMEAANWALLNQSDLVNPTGMTLRDHLLTTAAFTGALSFGSILRTGYVARQGANFAGIEKRGLQVASEHASAVGADGAIGLSASFTDLGIAKLMAQGATDITDASIREAAQATSLRLKTKIKDTANEFATNESAWVGKGRQLKEEQLGVLLENGDASIGHGLLAIRDSEFALTGIEKRAEAAVKSREGFLTRLSRENEGLTPLQEDAASRARTDIADLVDYHVSHMMSDGTYMAHGETLEHIGWRGGRLEVQSKDNVPAFHMYAGQKTKGGTPLEIGADLQAAFGSGKTKSLLEITQLAAGYKEALATDSWKAYAKNATFDVEALGQNYLGVHALTEYVKTLPKGEQLEMLSRVKLPDGVQTLDDLAEYSFRQRVDAALEFMQQTKKDAKAGTEPTHNPYDYSLRFGLNFADRGGRGNAFFDAMAALAEANPKMKALPDTVRNKKDAAEFAAYIGALGRTSNPDVIASMSKMELEKSLYKYDWNTKPMMFVHTQQRYDAALGRSLRDQMVAEQGAREARFIRSNIAVQPDPENPIPNMLDAVYASTRNLAPMKQEISDAATAIINGMQRGNAVTQALTTKAFQLDSMAGGAAARMYAAAARKAGDTAFEDLTRPLISQLRDLAAPAAKADQFSFNSYVSAMKFNFPVKPGFDEGRILIDVENETSKKIWKAITGKDLEGKIAYVPDPVRLAAGEIVPLKLTSKAMEVADNFAEVAHHDLLAANRMRYTNKQELIGDRPHYLPYASEYNKEQSYIVDQHGKLQAIVPGRTFDEVSAHADQRIAEMSKRNPDATYSKVTTADIQEHRRLFDQAVTENVSIADEAAGKGKYAQFFKVADDNTVSGSLLEAFRRRNQDHVTEFLRSEFKEPLALNKLRADSANVKNAFDKAGDRIKDDAFSLFESAILGTSTYKPGSWVQKVDKAVQSATELADRYITPHIERVYTSVKDMLPKNAVNVRDGDWASISDKLKAELGYAPFTDALEYARNVTGYKPSETVHSIMQKANGAAAYTFLYAGDVGYAVTNLLTPYILGPGQMALLKRMAGESVAEYKFRVKGLGHMTDSGTYIPTETHMLTAATQTIFDPEFNRLMKKGTEAGIYKAHSYGDFNRINVPHARDEGFMHKMFSSDSGWLTAMARNGDDLSVKMAMAQGYAMIKNSGIKLSDDMMLAYMKSFAGRINGDYSPINKPEFYRTTAGLPFGLFQTFMTNYAEGLVGMIESGSTRALMTQQIMQGAIFGARSLPGWEQTQSTMFRSWDGKTSLDGHVRTAYGQTGYDILMNGPLWSIPKVFGGDGIGLYTRGDANIRPTLPGLTSVSDLATISFVKNSYKALGSAFEYAVSTGNDRAAWETLVRSIPNRPLRGLLEAGQGYATNNNGRVTYDHAGEPASIFNRMMGARTMTEIEAARLTYDINNTENRQRAQSAALRQKLMGYIRAGNTDKLDDIAKDYVKNGGDMEQFGRWFNETAQKANVTFSDQKLRTAVKKSKSFGEAVAISDAMINR